MLRSLRRALFSVSDKSGLVDFARTLVDSYGVELLATGGTLKTLHEAGLAARDVAEVTGFPEILDGRVKTLHPALYAGLLARRDKAEHMATLVEHQLLEIDLVVCNLYPFEKTIAKDNVTQAEAIENIDIGGPCMVRAAAKNFAAVCVATEVEDYKLLLRELETYGGTTTQPFRQSLATRAFERIARYDHAIASYFLAQAPAEYPYPTDRIRLEFQQVQELRYGENPHQKASFYAEPNLHRACIASATQLHGKELSYNNILDLDSAFNLAREFSEAAAVVVKHNNPCGAATAATLAEAFDAAWEGDPLSAFGGILAFNRIMDAATAERLATGQRFVECVIAPDFTPEAFEILTTKPTWKKNVRLLKTGPLVGGPLGRDYRRVDGGLLVQDRDVGADDPMTWKVVTEKAPSDAQRAALEFAWTVCKHVKSNAIVMTQGTKVVGVGAGQMSRVDSTRIAVEKAGSRSEGAVLASDAFFPFADNVETAAKAGITAFIQPGGSVRDQESIDTCNRLGLPMLFTGIRHFRH